MQPPSGRARILILAREPLVAALLGVLVDCERFEPLFPEGEEPVEETLARLRSPTGAGALIEGTLDAVRSDLFFARAARSRVRIILFAPPLDSEESAATAEAIAALANRRHFPFIQLPIGRDDLLECLELVAEAQ